MLVSIVTSVSFCKDGQGTLRIAPRPTSHKPPGQCLFRPESLSLCGRMWIQRRRATNGTPRSRKRSSPKVRPLISSLHTAPTDPDCHSLLRPPGYSGRRTPHDAHQYLPSVHDCYVCCAEQDIIANQLSHPVSREQCYWHRRRNCLWLDNSYTGSPSRSSACSPIKTQGCCCRCCRRRCSIGNSATSNCNTSSHCKYLANQSGPKHRRIVLSAYSHIDGYCLHELPQRQSGL